MTRFFETIHCLSRFHCETCRNKEKGRNWRQRMLAIFKTDNVGVDFECPFGIPWGGSSAVKMDAPPQTQERPVATVKKASSLARALFSGKYVSEEILKERVSVCGRCKFLRVTSKGVEWCGVCGCKTSAETRKISNLAAYEEHLPHWGCKHPNRKNGEGWKR